MGQFDDVNGSLFRTDIFEDFQDYRKFKYILTINCQLLARRYGCSLKISERKVRNLHDLYLQERTRGIDQGSPKSMTQLDHLKDAAYFCFWFRRSSPIGEVHFLSTLGERQTWPQGIAPADASRDLFSLYADEVCAFLLSFWIVSYFEYIVIRKEPIPELPISSTAEADSVYSHLREICSMLKHKNMSPQAIYLMLKFLFTDGLKWK